MLVAAIILAGAQAVAHAAGTGAAPRFATVTFHLRVEKAPPAGMTFWVAYGPPEPRFGVVQLVRTQSGQYIGSQALPQGSRAAFTYLAAFGAVHTRAGLMPGGRVVVLKRTAPVSLGLRQTLDAVWAGPHG
jgi:hypothetical protein